MRVVALGPNLPSHLGGEMIHAHAEGCADIKRKRYPTDPRWDVETIEVGSMFQLAHNIYGDQIAESSDRDDPDDWKTYLAAISVFPCVKLPEYLPYVVDDRKDVPEGGTISIVADFATHDEAAKFVSSLPEVETGRYGICGPADD